MNCREIKSVKLKNDYRNLGNYIPKGTKGELRRYDWAFINYGTKHVLYASETEIMDNLTNLFEIEWEYTIKEKTFTVRWKELGELWRNPMASCIVETAIRNYYQRNNLISCVCVEDCEPVNKYNSK